MIYSDLLYTNTIHINYQQVSEVGTVMPSFTERQKLDILKLLDEGKSHRDIMNICSSKPLDSFIVSKGSISNISKNRSNIISRVASNSRLTGKSLILDQMCWSWYSEMLSRNIRITGTMLQNWAKRAAESIQYKDFKCSNGWLEKFNKRHEISSKTQSVENSNSFIVSVDNWTQNIMTLCEGYTLDNIFNCDETGLFWRGVPTKSLASEVDKCKRGELAMERVTILLTASATGEKLKPFVIAKSCVPCSFNKQLSADVHWRANAKAWMTAVLFSEYLQDLNSTMKEQNRSIILLLDSAPCHPSLQLSNVKLLFLPSNSTKSIKPFDCGIINDFKYHYRKFLIDYITGKASAGQFNSVDPYIKTLNHTDMVTWIKEAWSLVNSTTIVNSFKICGMHRVDDVVEARRDIDVQNKLSDNEVNELMEIFSVEYPQDIYFIDDLPTFETTDISTVESRILSNKPIDDNNVEASDEEESVNLVSVDGERLVSFQQMVEAWEVLKNWTIHNDESAGVFSLPEIYQKEKLIHEVSRKRKRQSTLTRYFH